MLSWVVSGLEFLRRLTSPLVDLLLRAHLKAGGGCWGGGVSVSLHMALFYYCWSVVVGLSLTSVSDPRKCLGATSPLYHILTSHTASLPPKLYVRSESLGPYSKGELRSTFEDRVNEFVDIFWTTIMFPPHCSFCSTAQNALFHIYRVQSYKTLYMHLAASLVSYH